jgi:hypothetical protein
VALPHEQSLAGALSNLMFQLLHPMLT